MSIVDVRRDANQQFYFMVGGKKALRSLIYTMFPANFDRYIEVFGGGGWVLFGKPPDDRCMEVYKHYNLKLANLFYCVNEPHGGIP